MAVKITENTVMVIYSSFRRSFLAVWLCGLLVACAAPQKTVVAPTESWHDAEDVIASGYRGISDKYIEPLDVGLIAMDGINGFASIDPALGAERKANSVILTYSGRKIFSAPTPPLTDVQQWAKLTSEMANQARGFSEDMRMADSEKLYEAVFDGVLSKLDLFSRYAGAEDARRNRARRDGFGGIGIGYKLTNGVLHVVSVTPRMPADESGIRVDDIITHIDGVPVDNLTAREVTSQVRGPTHTTVRMTVTRKGLKAPEEHKLMRVHIVPITVTEKNLGGVLYYKITSFNQDTSHSLSLKLASAVDSLGDQLKGIVLDMRGNPGGLLKQSVKVADLFLTQGNIVSTKGRHADSLHVYEAGGRDLTGGLPLLLLIDGKSASAAEIVATALQDRERAVLVGTSSYGKGTVQTVLRLPNDGEITLTWSRLVAPSGYTLHGLGVRPEFCTGSSFVSIAKLVDSTLETKLSAKDIFEQWRTSGYPDKDRRQKLRESCPAARRSSDIELDVARHLIDHPRNYAQALSLSAAPHQAHK